MGYCTADQARMMNARFADTTAFPDTIFKTFIEDASDYINVRLSRFYIIPLQPAPGGIVKLTKDLVHAMLLRRSFGAQDPKMSKLAEQMIKDVDDFIDRCLGAKQPIIILQKSSLIKGVYQKDDGSLVLGALDTSETSEIWSSSQDYEPVFGLDPFEEHVIDPQLLSDRRKARLESRRRLG